LTEVEESARLGCGLLVLGLLRVPSQGASKEPAALLGLRLGGRGAEQAAGSWGCGLAQIAEKAGRLRLRCLLCAKEGCGLGWL
jgi:hypothetical protein